ncbi:MAG: hypothetical protein M0018_05485 [Nitrospiraceae bacterium]|nr:hypothetical protein [Nitrospiraceae bacterium]
MKSKGPAARLYLAAAIVLAIGMGSAVFIYIRAAGRQASSPYDALGNGVYVMDPQNSKTYVHDMELYGGKANMLTDDFTRWFDGLWHGKPLALTVLFISVLVSAGLSFAARTTPPAQDQGLASRPE